MKKTALLFGVFLSFLIDSGLHASADSDEFNIYIRQLGSSALSIYSHLRKNVAVPVSEIEKAFSAITSKSVSSGSSSDEEGKSREMAATQDEQVEYFIEEFGAATEEYANDRNKTEEEMSSWKDFIEKVRARKERNNPVAVKYVLRNIAENFC